MAEHVIRQDVIEVSLQSKDALDDLLKINKELDELKKALLGAGKEDGLEQVQKDAAELATSTEKAKKELKQFGKVDLGQLPRQLKTIRRGVTEVAKELAKVSFKAMAAGLGAATAGVGALTKQTFDAYAEQEQLLGGVQTLLGAKEASSVEEYAKLTGKAVADVRGEYEALLASQDLVLANANDAFKTAGVSANDYLDIIISTAGSLLQSVGGDTQKAAEYGDMAVKDMADNANKMGTDLAIVQETYQSLARGNYEMLDNLRLGYGGTKAELQRLVQDAAALDDSVDASSLSYGNLVKAIHAVQVEMGIYGTTQKEAEHTITGSLNMLKAAWGNLLPALVEGGDTFDRCLDNLVYSAGVFADNALPVLERALGGIGELIEAMAPKIEQAFPSVVEQLLPPLIKAAASLLKGLIVSLPIILKTLIQEIPTIAKELAAGIAAAFGSKSFENPIFNALAKVGLGAIGALAGGMLAVKGIRGIRSIQSVLTSLGGAGKGAGEAAKGAGGITGMFEQLARTKASVVLKGMANLAIILGGLGALLFVASKVFKNGVDFGEMAQVMVLIGLLGGLGTLLSKFAGTIGMVSISTVLKGLANMALVLGGLGALLYAATKVFKNGVNFQQMTQVIALVGIVGVAGGAMAAFAGVVGLIPFPLVLSGLANMALVLGGLSAIIIAFGALGKIPGFNEFIKTGGDVLANLFNQIGKIIGSLVGGLGEGITNSLPVIGQNLSQFAEALQPMFTALKGVDVGGIGAFFRGIGAFILDMAANNALSVFAGKTDLVDFGNQLTQFAGSSSGFFVRVASLPAAGFGNAKLLFQSLSDIGNIPKTGGIKQWFTGETDYTALANGLAQLSNDSVIRFFQRTAEMSAEGFDNAKLLFQSLSEIGNIPKTGGIKQWFTGDADLSGLAQRLPSFGISMARFYQTIAGIDDFSKISALFQSLANIGEVPKSGGVKQWFTGDNNLTELGAHLQTFGRDLQGFSTAVANLDLDRMNAVWDSLQRPEQILAGFEGALDKDMASLISKVSQLPKKMGDGLKNAGQSLSQAIVAIWKQAAKDSAKPVNKIIAGANWILQQFGSAKRIATWTPYANGTDGHPGGNALVNDGRGAELVQMPNGQTFLPRGRNVLIPNAPRGMRVLSAERTAELLGRTSPTFRYAGGVGSMDIWSYLGNPKGLVDAVAEKYVSYGGISGLGLHIGKSMVGMITGRMAEWVQRLFDSMGGMSLAGYQPSKGVEQWRSTVIRALRMEGLYSPGNVALTLYQMQTESGGNPRAINLWDSNAKRGTPSKGLMQVIDPTFRAYARPGYDQNIYDPLSNILAAIRYARARYGSLANAFRGHGYADGGLITRPHVGLVGEAGNEMIIPLSRHKRKRGLALWQQAGGMLGMPSGGYSPETDMAVTGGSGFVEYNNVSPQFHLTIHCNEDGSGRVLERKVKRWVKETMEDTFDMMERKNPRLQEI